MPNVTGTTINGKIIDSTFFKNKVTLINFMYIGCASCMAETKELAKINSFYQRNDFQILCISPHTAEQLKAFLSDKKSDYSDVRKYYKIDKIEYEILPECDRENPNKKKHNDGNTYVQPECNRLSKPFKVDGYPESFLIDKNGIVRNSYSGFAFNDSTFEKKLHIDIEKLLE